MCKRAEKVVQRVFFVQNKCNDVVTVPSANGEAKNQPRRWRRLVALGWLAKKSS